ncbi:MAG: ribonuclease J [Parcubacteria group bacterium LiPW_41]|nr:MAG: ribonuclease J [Parcubacteria group bacterium LiPW_41]
MVTKKSNSAPHGRRYGAPRDNALAHSVRKPIHRKTESQAHTPKEEPVRFVALGGLEEIGRNMMFLEYKDEIIIIDAGLQFAEEGTPGVDYIIPNVSYLEKNKKNIKAFIITHAHYDHIGAIPHIMDKIGNPPIYATNLTKEIVLKRQEDYPLAPKPRFQLVKSGETYQFGKYFSATFFDVVHNIPEGIGIIFRTPVGNIVHPGEFKFDYDHEGKPRGLHIWEQVGKEGINVLMLDSTGAEVPGFSLSERIVEAELEKIFLTAKGRILVGSFASLIDRLGEVIKIAEKLGRKVAISGLSMKTNIQIAQNLGYLKFKKDTIISLDEINKHPDNKLILLCTGAQGEAKGSFMRIANGEHKQIRMKEGDTVVLSSSVVPGNERSVQNLKDNLARRGALVFHHKMLDIHSSGHAPQGELSEVMRLIKPKNFLPIHGYYFMRWRNARLAQEVLGLKPENTILADNGNVVNIYSDCTMVSKEQIQSDYVMVDGLGVGDVGEVVLRDRITLSQEGMLVIITTLSKQDGKILKNPDIISRGFIYLKENQEMLDEMRKKIRNTITHIPNRADLDSDYLKTVIREQISSFIFNKTKRRPMILPVIIEV